MGKIKSVFYNVNMFIHDLYKVRRLIFKLVLNDFKSKYTGSFIGILWGYIVPLVNILVFWYVFQIGLKQEPVAGTAFILWLICGLIPWFYFQESLQTGTGCLFEYSYLVKKVKFRVSLLPIVKILSSLVIHIFFVILIYIMFFIYGFEFKLTMIQLLYYSIATTVLLIGVSWITSSLSVFIQDIKQIVTVFLQIGFWFTPILWNLNSRTDTEVFIFKLNPLYYIVNGYRASMIEDKWFWEYPYQTIYFWCVTITLLVIGALCFRKLRPHFADVL